MGAIPYGSASIFIEGGVVSTMNTVIRFLRGLGPWVSLILGPVIAFNPSWEVSSARAAVYAPETFALANGLQVVVITNHRVPIVTHMVWYKVGSGDDPAGRSGIAHFLEHLMFKGTANVPAGEFSKIVAKNGGRDNAFTAYDYTAFFQDVARDRLELVMRMEADRMTGLRLSDEVVYPERDVIVEERRQRVENSPDDRLLEEFNATLFPNSHYGVPTIGWGPEMSTLTREDAESFYKTWYAPNNAIVVVSGDVTAEELRPLAEKYYGVIPAKPVPKRVRPAVPDLFSARRVILSDPEIRQPMVVRAWIAPSARTAASGVSEALQVAAEAIGGGSDSRLYRALVSDGRLASSVWVHYSPNMLEDTSLTVGGSPAANHTADEIEKALGDEVTKLLKDGVTEEEVARAKSRMITAAAYARDGVSGPANAVGAALAVGETVDDIESWPDRVAAVDKDEVDAALKAVLSRPDHVTGLLLSAEEEKRP